MKRVIKGRCMVALVQERSGRDVEQYVLPSRAPLAAAGTQACSTLKGSGLLPPKFETVLGVTLEHDAPKGAVTCLAGPGVTVAKAIGLARQGLEATKEFMQAQGLGWDYWEAHFDCAIQVQAPTGRASTRNVSKAEYISLPYSEAALRNQLVALTRQLVSTSPGGEDRAASNWAWEGLNGALSAGVFAASLCAAARQIAPKLKALTYDVPSSLGVVRVTTMLDMSAVTMTRKRVEPGFDHVKFTRPGALSPLVASRSN